MGKDRERMKNKSEQEPDGVEVSSGPEEAAEATEEAKPAVEAPAELPREDPLKILEAECAALREQMIRRQADFENFRKRNQREVAEFKQLAAADLTEALLPVLDAFERALHAKGGESIEDYIKGFELIYRQLYDTLMRFGLTPVRAAGHPFDPYYHYAVERVESTAHKDQTIVEELQRGYTFKHKLLRPAMVRVAVQPAPADPAEAKNSEESEQEK